MNHENKGKIDWDYSGKTELTVGTGALPMEKVIGMASGAVIPILIAYFYLTGLVAWSLWQFILALVLAADLSGGVVANALNSCKRFYHSPYKLSEPRHVKILKNHWWFTIFHIHPVVIYLFFDPSSWMTGILWYGIFLASAAVVIKLPLYLQRPASMLIALLAILLNQYFIDPVKGFEWFIPILFLKIIAGHIVREEPYRP